MKKIRFILLMLLVPFLGLAQTYTGTPTTWSQNKGKIGADKGVVFTFSDTIDHSVPNGTVRLNSSDTSLYVFNGAKWIKTIRIAASGGGSNYKFISPLSVSNDTVSIDLSSYATNSALTTGLATKQNTLGYTAESTSNKTTDANGTSNSLYPSQGAVKSFVESSIAAIPTFDTSILNLETRLGGKQNNLGFTPYNATNPAGYITSSALSPYLTIATAASTYQPIGSYLTSETDPTFNTKFAAKSTSDLTEGTNKYYTDAKVSAVIDADTGRAVSSLATGGSLNKVRDSLQTNINLKANLASPTFTGVPAGPTATALTNTTQLATTAFVTTADNLKANLASPTFTGIPSAPTATAGTNTTQIATTAHVFAERTNTATLTNKTLTSPSIATPLITGLSSGTTNDSLLVADPSTGAVRRISSSRIGGGGGSGWSLTGNSGLTAGANYIGTNDNTDIWFKAGLGGVQSTKLVINSSFNTGSLPVLGSKGTASLAVCSGDNLTPSYGLLIGTLSSGDVYQQSQRIDGSATSYNMSLQPSGGSLSIGTSTIAASAIVNIASTSKGFLPPRMTGAQAAAIASKDEGLMVYVTDSSGGFAAKGWYGWNGAGWDKLNP